MTPLIAFLPIFTLCVLSSNIGSIFITVYGDCEVEVGGELSANKNTILSFFFEIPNKTQWHFLRQCFLKSFVSIDANRKYDPTQKVSSTTCKVMEVK